MIAGRCFGMRPAKTRLPQTKAYRRAPLPQRANLAEATYPVRPPLRDVPRKGYGTALEMTPEAVDTPVDADDIRLQVAEILALDADGRRVDVAASMSGRLGNSITKTMIDQWTRGSRLDKNMSAAWIAAWCEATGSTRLMEFIAAQTGLEAVDPATARWGRFARNVARELKELWAEVA